jgi:hypothetical protein
MNCHPDRSVPGFPTAQQQAYQRQQLRQEIRGSAVEGHAVALSQGRSLSERLGGAPLGLRQGEISKLEQVI